MKEFIFSKVADVQSETLLKIEFLHRPLQLYWICFIFEWAKKDLKKMKKTTKFEINPQKIIEKERKTQKRILFMIEIGP